MADVKTLKTRIALKIDTLENWGNSSIKLMPGEVAFATVAAGAGTGLTEPVIMAKIGTDEEKTFAELPWAFHAKASDVLAACKSEEGLRTFVNGVIADAGIASSDAMEALAGRVTTTEGAITTLNGDADTAGSVAKSIADAIADLENTYVAIEEGKSLVADTEIARLAAMKDGANKVEASTTNGSIKIDGVETVVYTHPEKHTVSDISDFDTSVKAYDYATKTEAQGYATTEAGKVQSALDGYEESNDATVEAITGRVTTAEGKINTLVATDADKSAREIATEEAETAANAMKDAILGEGIKDTFDTLKEIQDWIEGDGVNATELTDALAGEAALRGEADEALGKRIDAIDNHSHANKELLDTYAQTEANLADAVAKKHSHSFTDADVEDAISKEHVHANSGILDNLTQDVIDNAHTHANKGVLDGITAEKVTAWDAAEQNAKDYADGAIASNNTTIMGSFSIVEQNLTTEINKKANDADLAAIAKTGNVDDLVQTEGTYIIFDCGDSTVNA